MNGLHLDVHIVLPPGFEQIDAPDGAFPTGERSITLDLRGCDEIVRTYCLQIVHNLLPRIDVHVTLSDISVEYCSFTIMAEWRNWVSNIPPGRSDEDAPQQCQ